MLLMERTKSLWTTGTVAATVAAVGDFFSSVHGYWITILVAFVALALAVRAYLRSDPAPPGVHDSIPAIARWSRHWVQIFLVFAGVTGAIGVKSWMLAKQGGILASSIPVVSNLQDSMGLLRKNLEMQQGTREAIDHLASTVKKETSNDPRKELANRGIAWTDDALVDAMDHRDTETIDLFLRAKFNMVESKFVMARIGMRYFSSSEFEHQRPVLEQLYAGGLDFIRDYADRLDRSRDEGRVALYGNPVMTVLKDGNIEVARWLIHHGDTSTLSSFAEVLAEGLRSCPESEHGLEVARFLVQSGIPAARAREAVAASPNGPGSPDCQRVAKALQP